MDTKSSPSRNGRPLHAHFDAVAAHAEAIGLTCEAAESLVGVDAALFMWRRRLMKGELVRTVLARLQIDIEQAEFEAMTAVSRLTYGIGNEPRPRVTIGDIAEELRIDPSRASRLITALVSKGYLRREIVQSDARKTSLRLTDTSKALFQNFMTQKWSVIFDAFADWQPSEIADFERLLSRYLDSMQSAIDRIGPGTQKDGHEDVGEPATATTSAADPVR